MPYVEAGADAMYFQINRKIAVCMVCVVQTRGNFALLQNHNLKVFSIGQAFRQIENEELAFCVYCALKFCF